MSDFRKLRLTAKGRELLALAHQGTELQLLNIVIGNGAWPEENQTGEPPTDLVNQKKVVTVTGIEQSGEVAKAKGMLTNNGLTTGFAITEIGVTAMHPVDGEILYMADYCDVAVSSYIPDNTGSPVEMPLSLDVFVSSSQDVTLVIDDRFFSATKKDIDDHDADPDAHQPLVDRLHVSTPAITSPTPGQLDVIETPAFLSTAFESHFAGVGHTHSQFQVDVAAGDWTTPAHDSGADAVNLTSYTVSAGVLGAATVYKVRVRHKCGPDGLWSEWSPVITFTTLADFVYVEQPTNQSPTNAATDVEETPTLQASAFVVTGGSDTHDATEFRILQGGSVVHTSTGLGAVTSYEVPQGVLAVSTEYTWDCRYSGVTEGWGERSTPTTFTTAAVFFTSDDAVVYDPATPADWPIIQTMDTASGLVATADDAHAYSDAEVQGGGETDWGKLAAVVGVKNPEELTVDGASTTSSLVLTSLKSGLLADGDKVLLNDGAAGTDLIETVLASVTEERQIPTGCIHEWLLDGDANDSIGSQNGTVNGSCTYGAGRLGQALSTPGTTGNYLSMPQAAFDFSGPISFGFWVKTTEASYVVASTQNMNDSGFMINPADGACFVASGGAYVVNPSGTNAGFNDGQWHHYFFTWDGSTGADKVSVYLDGVLKWTGTATGAGSATHKSTVNFGRFSDADTWSAMEVDDIRAFSRELTAAEVAGLMGGKYTCTSITPSLSAVPDVTFLPVPLHEAHGADGATWDGPEDFTAIALASATYVDNAGVKTITFTSEQIEPDPSFRQAALGVSGLPDGAEITAAQLNLDKIAS